MAEEYTDEEIQHFASQSGEPNRDQLEATKKDRSRRVLYSDTEAKELARKAARDGEGGMPKGSSQSAEFVRDVASGKTNKDTLSGRVGRWVRGK